MEHDNDPLREFMPADDDHRGKTMITFYVIVIGFLFAATLGSCVYEGWHKLPPLF